MACAAQQGKPILHELTKVTTNASQEGFQGFRLGPCLNKAAGVSYAKGQVPHRYLAQSLVAKL